MATDWRIVVRAMGTGAVGRRAALAAALALAVTSGGTAPGQLVPGVPGGATPSAADGKSAAANEKEKEKEKAKEKVATVAGTIKVDATIDDPGVRDTLETLLPQYPGVRRIRARVNQGVVKLDGLVDDDDTRNQMTQVAKQVEGVRLVINRLSTDAEVLTAPQLVEGKLLGIWDYVARHWLLILLAVGIVMAFSWLARVFNDASETLLAPFVQNPMLRSVFGSLIGSGIFLGGLMLGLSILNLTHAVLSVLGLAGVAGLAVGFAFKDIAENFIASVLLGVRRPFRVGDYIIVAGQTGVVRSLNTRATVLVTLEGHHVRIPNNIVYKEILTNATASPSLRSSFDVVVPYDSSTADAVEAMTRALREVDGVLPDPPARALVEALEPGGVRLRGYYWLPVQNADWFQLNSDAKLRVKVALQQAKVLVPAPPAAAAPGVTVSETNGAGNGASAKAAANLRNDARAAEAARTAPDDGRPTPMQHALHQSETHVSDEGANLLAGAR